MVIEKINYDYLNVAKEIPLLLKLELKKIGHSSKEKPKKILIINTSIIGDFIVSIPALYHFIKRNKVKIDMVVSPPIKPLAEKIRGINKVYTAKSIYNRSVEDAKTHRKSSDHDLEYDLVLVMRISKDAYDLIKKIKFKSMQSYFKPYFKCMFNYGKRLLIKGDSKQWSEVNFDIVKENIKSKTPHFNIMFDFKKSDYGEIMKLKEMKGNKKKILIHTGAPWGMKLWSNKNWANLLKKINKVEEFKFIFIGSGKKDGQNFKEIESKLNFKIYSLINKINLKDLILVMKSSDYFIGIDSGPRNMANLVDIPSVNLIGHGLKNFMPQNKRDIVLDKSDYDSTELFFYKKKSSMQRITVDEVFNGFKKLLKS